MSEIKSNLEQTEASVIGDNGATMCRARMGKDGDVKVLSGKKNMDCVNLLKDFFSKRTS